MDIVEVGPGLAPIPPVGFGAIERVVWQLYLALRELGDSVLIYNQPTLDPIALAELFPGRLAHCHWAGHALALMKYGVPYAYTSHSHIWRTTDYRAIMGSSVYLALHAGMVPDEYAGHVEIVGNGVDANFWRQLGRDRQPTVVSCANFSDRKRLHWMFDLVDLLPSEWAGVIIGPNVPASLGPGISPRVTLLGEMSAVNLVDVYNRAMAGFHPAREEAFALVPMEMAACGLMTFVSRDSYVYHEQSGIYCFDDVEEAADMLLKCAICYDPQVCRAGVESHHSWRSVAEKVRRGLENLDG